MHVEQRLLGWAKPCLGVCAAGKGMTWSVYQGVWVTKGFPPLLAPRECQGVLHPGCLTCAPGKGLTKV